MTNQEILSGGLEKVSKAAKRLGIGRNTLYQWIQQGKVAYTNINGTYRIPSRAVDNMLVAGLNFGNAAASPPECLFNAPGRI
jgi:excisionase family DNA binding protein